MTATLRTIGSGMDHPEGVAYSDRHGLYCGGEAGQIYSVDLETGAHREVAHTGGFVLGVAFGPESRLFVCDSARSAVLSISVNDGDVSDFSTGKGVTLAVPNYLAFATDGTLYVSDSGAWGQDDGRVVVFSASEGARVLHSGLGFANGVALSADRKYLYVIESSNPRVGRISLAAEGGAYSVLFEMPGMVPDGIAVCDDGTLVVACYRPDTVFLWSEADGVQTLSSDPLGLTLAAPTNVAFAGSNRDRLISANLAGYHLTEIVDSGRRGVTLPFTT